MMKKFFALIFSLLCVGMIFVGCSKETDQYFYDVYDYWNDKVNADQNVEYFNKSQNITFNSSNINELISTEFSEIKKYQEIFNSLKNDVEQLSFDFVHDPQLDGKELKNAQQKVTEYKEQLQRYEEEIDDFKNVKNNFETACSNLEGSAGIIEKDEYKEFLSSYRGLISSLNQVFSKMYSCAQSMFYSGKVSGFRTNKERANAIKETCFETKILLTQDYIYFCYEHTDSTQPQTYIDTIYDNYNAVRKLTLNSDELEIEQSEETLPKIDGTIEALATWIKYYKSESSKIKSEMQENRFRFSLSGLEINSAETAIIKENHEKYLNLINSTMKNLSKTCGDLVAFY